MEQVKMAPDQSYYPLDGGLIDMDRLGWIDMDRHGWMDGHG